MDERELEHRVARLEERLSRLESRLTPPPLPPAQAGPRPVIPVAQVVPPPASPATSAAPQRVSSFVAEQEAAEEAAAAERAAKAAAYVNPMLRDHAGAATPGATPESPRVRQQQQPPPMPSPVPRPVAPQPATPVNTFEAQVGLKWAGWAGAIIVVIGAALGIKYAYDQQWFGNLPPAARLALMSLGGFALLAAGEAVYRRVGAVASAGLYGAGVATLFVVSYAGYEYFGLYARESAFALMGVVTLIGAAVAMRGKLVSIATLSIVGGNVAPIVLSTKEPQLLSLFVYLLVLQVLALFLAWWGRTPKWWTLRGVALATLCLWMLVPVLGIDEFPGQPRGTTLLFALVYAALFHLELVITSLRGPKPVELSGRELGMSGPHARHSYHDAAGTNRGIGVTFSLLVTTAAAIAVLSLLRIHTDLYRGAWTLGLAACCLALGLILPRLVRNRSPQEPPSLAVALGLGYRVQAAALVVVAVPVSLSGVWITTTWGVLALALAVVGAKVNLSVSRAASVFIWLLAAGHLGLWTLGSSIGGGGAPAAGPTAIWGTVLGQPLPAYLFLAALLAVAAHAIAALLRANWSGEATVHHAASADGMPIESAVNDAPSAGGTVNLNYERRDDDARALSSPGFLSLSAVTDVLGALLFVLAMCGALPTVGLTGAMLVQAWVLMALGYVARPSELHPLGLLLMGFAAGKWLLHDTLGPVIYPTGTGVPWATYQPVFNAVAYVGVGLLASAAALLRAPLLLPDRRWSASRSGLSPDESPARRLAAVRAVAGFAGVVIGVWLLSAEVNRYFDARATVAASAARAEQFRFAKQVTLSVVWAVYAIGCVTAGFAVRVAGLRYFGLGLFALTVVKVMLVDLGELETGYRILSFLVVGLLLLGVSVLYGKLSPLLLRHESPKQPPLPRPALGETINPPLGGDWR